MILPLHGVMSPLTLAARRRSTLLNELLSYWPLDERSGVRSDLVGTSHLTDNNTVGFSPKGPTGLVPVFVKVENTRLNAADSPWLDQIVTVTGWFKRGSLSTAASGVIARYDGGLVPSFIVGTNGSAGYMYWWNDSGVVSFQNGGYTYSADVWTHVATHFDNTVGRLVVRLNGGAANGGTTLYGNTVGGVRRADGNAPLGVGAFSNGGGPFDGNVSRVGLYSAELSDEVLASLFNGGEGKSYAELTTADKTNLISYYDLSEAGGAREDSHGSNDLTDVNTVESTTSVVGAMSDCSASFIATNNEHFSNVNFVWTGRTQVSVSAWFRRHTLNSSYYLLLADIVSAVVFQFFGRGSDNAIACYAGAGGSNYGLSAPNAIPNNFTDWTHAVVTYDGTQATPAEKLKIYVNGVQKTLSFTGTIPTALGATTGIYLNRTGVGNYANMLEDEVALWGRAITPDEVSELYAAGAGVFYPF